MNGVGGACEACTAENEDLLLSIALHGPPAALEEPAEGGLRARLGDLDGVDIEVGSGGLPTGGVFPPTRPPGLTGVLEAAASAMTLRRSILLISQVGYNPRGKTHFSASTARDFQTGPLLAEPTDKSNGVTGRELLGVCAGILTEDGVDMTSSMEKMSSGPPLGVDVALKSGLRGGEGNLAPRCLAGPVVKSTGEITGERGFHFQGCRTLGAGMSCSANQSFHFSVVALTS